MAARLVAMILAGGKGTRLEALTRKIAKPAVSFGAKYRIIDFPLSNCANSGIRIVGILSQYESVDLDNYVGNGEKWGLNGVRCLTATLPPRQTEEGLSWYKGTADAIYSNIDFLDGVNAEYVLVLSGDHIYSMTYDAMFEQHLRTGADCTIAVTKVAKKEASRFGILTVDENNRVLRFAEKPKHPESRLASMGIYIFTYRRLRRELIEDARDEKSSHDFGKDVIPKMLAEKRRLGAYLYQGYWRDVGTLASLHEANMDLLAPRMARYFTPRASRTRKYVILSEDTNSLPLYIGKDAVVRQSLVNQGAVILGSVVHSVVSNEVYVSPGALVEDSVLMTGARIGENAKVRKALVGPGAVVQDGEEVGDPAGKVVLFTRKKVKGNE